MLKCQFCNREREILVTWKDEEMCGDCYKELLCDDIYPKEAQESDELADKVGV